MTLYSETLDAVFTRGAHKRLSATELADTLDRYRAGADDIVTVTALVLSYAPFMRRIARQTISPYLNDEDKHELRCIIASSTLMALRADTPVERAVRKAVEEFGRVSRAPMSIPPRTMQRYDAAMRRAKGDADEARANLRHMSPEVFDAIHALRKPVQVERIDRPVEDDDDHDRDAAMVVEAMHGMTLREWAVIRGTFGIGRPPVSEAVLALELACSVADVRATLASALRSARETLGVPEWED